MNYTENAEENPTMRQIRTKKRKGNSLDYGSGKFTYRKTKRIYIILGKHNNAINSPWIKLLFFILFCTYIIVSSLSLQIFFRRHDHADCDCLSDLPEGCSMKVGTCTSKSPKAELQHPSDQLLVEEVQLTPSCSAVCLLHL